MPMERIIRRFAGSFILISLLLARYHNPNWLWFTAFVGFNLLQSSFTNFCPLEIILKKLGVGSGAGGKAEKATVSGCEK
jgi:Inner membrane protein YgaP-like, transmembrane domain